MVLPNPGNPGNPNPEDNKSTPPAGAANPATPAPAVLKPGDTPTPGDKGGQTVPLAALQEEREKRQALQAELERLQSTQRYQPQPQQQPSQMVDPFSQNWKQEIEKLWDVDPRKAVQAEIMRAMTWYDQVNATVEIEADTLSTKYPDFNNYRSAALNYVRSLPHEQRGQQGIVELAYMLVRGQNLDAILKTKEEEIMKKLQAGQFAGQMNVPGAYSNSTLPSGAVRLSDEQRIAADAMGIPEEEYVKFIKPSPGAAR